MRYGGNEIIIKDIEKQATYYRKEQKVYRYANDFFKELVPFFDIIRMSMNDDVLPLYCFNEDEEILRAVKSGKNSYVAGGMIEFKKQAVIRIGLDCRSDKLTAALKRTIRHEIIHYCLWVMERKHYDNDLAFVCYCYVFDGGAYESLSDNDKEKFLLFKELYDKYILDLSYREKAYCLDNIIKRLENSEYNYEEYEKYVKEQKNFVTELFGD